jgi:hypothetical protein
MTGLKFRLDGEDIEVKWEDTKEVIHKVERLGIKDYHFLTINLDSEIAGKYNTIEVPVSSSFLDKVWKLVDIVTV